MIVSKFKIGDKVETTEEWRKRAEELNPLLSTTQITPYIKGTVTDIKEQVDYKTETLPSGLIRIRYPEIERTWISVIIDNEHLLNQNAVQKVKE